LSRANGRGYTPVLSIKVLFFINKVRYLRIGAAWGHAAYKVVGRVTDPALTSP
jgi:hypothetical protein